MFRILLAEDNPGDVLLFREALRGSRLSFEIVVAEDGDEAMAFLEDVADTPAGGVADLIVLDVNLPKHSGDEVLRKIRGRASLADVPVIMLTSSVSPEDKARSMKLGANLYLQKSSNIEQLFEIGRIVERMLERKGASYPEAASD